MRLSEQYGLLWKQVDLKRREIDLSKTKNGSPRTVPLNSITLAALERQQAALGPGRCRPNYPVFPFTGKGTDAYRAWFTPALAAAGITDCTWHTNRHTFCSWLAMAGVTLKEIQVLAGHKTIAMSARYSHLSPAHTLTASERLVLPS